MKILKYDEFNENLNNTSIENLETELLELFDEYETDIIDIEDLDLKYQGILMTCIIKDNDGIVHFWAGDPENDEYAEEFILDDASKTYIIDEIIKNM